MYIVGKEKRKEIARVNSLYCNYSQATNLQCATRKKKIVKRTENGIRVWVRKCAQMLHKAWDKKNIHPVIEYHKYIAFVLWDRKGKCSIFFHKVIAQVAFAKKKRETCNSDKLVKLLKRSSLHGNSQWYFTSIDQYCLQHPLNCFCRDRQLEQWNIIFTRDTANTT